MAKKRRTAKQVAATRKMQRANRRGKKRRNPIRAKARTSGAAERKPSKASRRRAGLKAARTREANKRKRSAAAKKGRRGGSRRKNRSKGRRSNGAFRRRPTKRQLAARRAVATRRRNAGYAGPYAPDASERRRKRRSRRRNPIAVASIAAAPRRRKRRRNPIAKRRNPIARVATERRRKRRRRNPIARASGASERKRPKKRGHKRNSYRRRGTHKRKYHHVKASSYKRGGKTIHRRRHMRNPLMESRAIANPIEGPMQFVGGFLGVGFGFALASLGDRLVTSHALNTAGQDAPAQGEIYNSEALQAPLWGNMKQTGWKRLLVAVGAVVVPLGAASAVKKHLGLKSFFQLAAFGALGRTAGKMVDDGVAHFVATKPLGQRLYGGEIAATGKLNAANLAALPAAPPGTFAGVPQNRQFSPMPPPPPPHVTRHVAQTPAAAQNQQPSIPQTAGFGLPGMGQTPNPYGLPFNPHLSDPDRNGDR